MSRTSCLLLLAVSALVGGGVAGAWTLGMLDGAGTHLPAQRVAENEWLPNYQMDCRAPWRELGAIGEGLWGCQAPEPLPGGFYPNCALTSSVVKPELTARAYYEAASDADPHPLSSLHRLGGREVRVHRHLGYEGSFEHRISGMSLRVLATTIVSGGRAFVITCSAPRTEYDALLPKFREVAGGFELGA